MVKQRRVKRQGQELQNEKKGKVELQKEKPSFEAKTINCSKIWVKKQKIICLYCRKFHQVVSRKQRCIAVSPPWIATVSTENTHR